VFLFLVVKKKYEIGLGVKINRTDNIVGAIILDLFSSKPNQRKNPRQQEHKNNVSTP
jgi:hypothetical protein